MIEAELYLFKLFFAILKIIFQVTKFFHEFIHIKFPPPLILIDFFLIIDNFFIIALILIDFPFSIQ